MTVPGAAWKYNFGKKKLEAVINSTVVETIDENGLVREDDYLSSYLDALQEPAKTTTGDAILDVAGAKRVLDTTWASLPAAADLVGFAYVTDVGINGSLWQSNGTIWWPVGNRVLLARANTAATALTGTTTQTVLDTIQIKGGIMGLNGRLKISVDTAMTNNANNKTLRFLLGGTQLYSNVLASFATATVSGDIINRNSQSSQLGSNGSTNYTASTNARPTGTVNTANDQNLTIEGVLANTGDSLTRESYEVWLHRG